MYNRIITKKSMVSELCVVANNYIKAISFSFIDVNLWLLVYCSKCFTGFNDILIPIYFKY